MSEPFWVVDMGKREKQKPEVGRQQLAREKQKPEVGRQQLARRQAIGSGSTSSTSSPPPTAAAGMRRVASRCVLFHWVLSLSIPLSPADRCSEQKQMVTVH